MICRLTGRVASLGPDAVVMDVGAVSYEVFVPATTLNELQEFVGREATLFTLQYFEGNPAGAHLIPRLIGFLSETEQVFFAAFTRVKGISNRRALRAMSLPVPQLAAAIESGDARLLTSLPEIGKKTAAQIITELRGHVGDFAGPAGMPVAAPALTDAQRVAVEILVQWGDRRADVERWVAAAVEGDPTLAEPDAIVRAAYRVKTTRGM